MSQKPRRINRRPPETQLDAEERGYEAYEEYDPQPETRGRSYEAREQSVRRARSPQNLPPGRDLFPYVMSAFVGGVLVGLLAIAYLLGTNMNRPTATQVPTSAGVPSGNQPGALSNNQPVQPAASGAEPPRMTMDEFKKLYDDPAKRPLIIDVRAKASYDEGHIKGSISFPEAEVDSRVAEMPKDRLVVAYCQ